MTQHTSYATLEAWYRRLLLAYPGHYRRRHGTEILTTLMETAEPDRRRPGRADVADLLTGGLRQRFRLPGSRPAVLLAAVLAVLAFGAFGAAAGSWLGERTFTALPSAAEADQLSGVIAGRPAGAAGGVPAGPVVSPSTAAMIGGATGPVTPDWTPEQALARLAGQGWERRSLTPAGPDQGCSGEFVAARSDGLVLHADVCRGEEGFAVKTTIFAVRSGAYLPFTVAGAIAGVLVGWLLAAGVAYRVRTLPPLRRALIGLLAAAGLACSVLPVVAFAANTRLLLSRLDDPDVAVHVLHAPLTPSWYFGFGPHQMIPAAAVGALLCAVAAVVLSRVPAAAHIDRAPVAG